MLAVAAGHSYCIFGTLRIQLTFASTVLLSPSYIVSTYVCFIQQPSLQHNPIKLYHYRGSFSSQKVLLYLHERGIDFSGFHVDLQRNEHLAPWYLEINPKGEVR